MMRSMFAGVSGLKSHQVRLDVIGNNIANVNTYGFKAGRVTFQDLLSQTVRGAAAPQGDRGGINPMQVGLGTKVASIDTLFSPGNLEGTGVNTDLAIERDGFFILGEGDKRYYTRAGYFEVDRDGNVINRANGLKLLGWQADNNGNIDPNGPLSVLRVPKGLAIAPQATTGITLAQNFDAGLPVAPTSVLTRSINVIDSLGIEHTLVLRFEKTNFLEWTWTVDSVTGAQGGTVSGGGTITFAPDGSFSAATGTIAFTPDNGANAVTINPDFSAVTQADSDESTVEIVAQNGYKQGVLENFAFDTSGVITGYFSNGLRRNLGQVALAIFNNPGGLIKTGDTLFEESNNSGMAQVGTAGSGGRGTIAPANLEMSNVDLAQEFTEMIITQRGFQANSRIITTSDEMLQELVNLKR